MGKSDAGNAEGLLDAEPDLPELQTFMQSGPNDVRDILVLDDGFLVATGAAIVRCQYSGGVAKATLVYTERHGLPSGNCYLLARDAEGGVWAHCQGGVAYLAAKAERWQTFTEKNGLASGNATDIALSPDGKRIWVTGTGGLSTALVRDRRWQVFPARNLIDVLVHPTNDVVWCRKLLRSGCMCGRHVLSSQFDLQSRTWRDIPESGACAHVAPIPSYFSVADGSLWMSAEDKPPMLYDPKKNATTTWPDKSKWQRPEDSKEVVDSEWFGEMLPATGDEGGVWFATNAGLWRYYPKKDEWQGHLRSDRPEWGQALLAKGSDANTLYWSCQGTLAAFDIAAGKWTELWDVDTGLLGEGRHHLKLSPDGTTLWLVGAGDIFVGELASRKAVTRGDADHPGLSAAKFVRFDPSRRLALIGTPQGVVCADYGGKLRFALSRPAPPILHRVSEFAFAPDGSEVWCLTVDEQGFQRPAAVLFPRENRWEVLPHASPSSFFYCVAFSPDGKTVWLFPQPGERERRVAEKKPGTSQWHPFRVKMPDGCYPIEKFWLTPTADELWMKSGRSGLLRVKLASAEVTQYAGSRSRRLDNVRHGALIGDYVRDLAFAAHGKFAVCSAWSSGNVSGITQIDLATGEATNYPTDRLSGEKLVVAPDDRTVWCVFNNSLLWAWDVETRSWTHKCSVEQGMPLRSFRTLACSPDGAFVWVHGGDGVAVYSVRRKWWKSFASEPWTCDSLYRPLCVTPDGKQVVCGHREGVALVEIDGSDYNVLSPGPEIKDCLVSHIVPAPRTGDYVCFVSHPEARGLYYLDVGRRSLRRLTDMRGSTVTAMAVGPDGFLWGAVPGGVFCVDPLTGKDRPGLEALRFGEPLTTVLGRDRPPTIKDRGCTAPGVESPCRGAP